MKQATLEKTSFNQLNNTRDRLLSCATELFYEQGFPNTSIRQIGKGVGITSSIIYHYFENKEEILFEILRSAIEKFYETLEQVIDSDSDPLDSFSHMIRVHIDLFTLIYKKEAKIWAFDYYYLDDNHQRQIRDLGRKLYGLYKTQILRLRERGVLNDVDPVMINFCVNGMMHWILQWMKLEGGRLSREEIAEQILQFVLNGVLKRA